MIIDSAPEVKLYTKESVELPSIIKDRFPRIQSVYQPESTNEIQQIFSFSRKNKLSIIPRGAATSGMGGIAPLRRSIMADLTFLNRILDFDEKKKTINFEAGLRWWELKKFLKEHSLDVYTCPTSLFSTVGGWLATGGYGINSFGFGHISNLVDSIETVTPDKKKQIDRKNPEFKYFIGTEGQMGIISKVTLKVRESKPSRHYLVLFKNTSEAAGFISELLRSHKIHPVHIVYYDRNRLEHKNLLLNGKVFFPQMEGVLIALEDFSAEEELLSLIEREKGILAENYLSAFLWNERYFPFSIKHFYPSILGCEATLPIKNLVPYMRRTKKFGEDYGIPLSTEATLINKNEVVVITIFPSDPKKLTHFLHLFLTYSLTHIAITCGGKPYGIGIWNLPLLKKIFSAKDIKEFLFFKKETDPFNLINPAKSFSQDFKITSLLKLGYFLSSLFSNGYPLLKPIFRTKNHDSKKPNNHTSESEACANCGACTVVCPAYLKTRTEIVTAKGKLFILKQLLRGSHVPAPVAEKIFLCLHCHLCEHVCQSKLILTPIWEKLESIVEKKYGRPKEKIENFVKQVESDPAYTQLFDTFGISSNNNHQEIRNV
ncbi:MAG: FAD-binding protein [Candidatus Aminicenantaceae bacterium]